MSPWVRLDDTFDDDPRVATVGLTAFGLLTACLCWNNRMLADGFIPAGVVRQKGGADGAALVDQLLAVGLFTKADRDGLSGYHLCPDLVKNQPTKAKVEADREAAKIRKDRWKEQRRNAEGTHEEQRSERDQNANGTAEERDQNAEGTREEQRSATDPGPADARNATGTAEERPKNGDGTAEERTKNGPPDPDPDPVRVPTDDLHRGRKVGKEGFGKPLEGNLESEPHRSEPVIDGQTIRATVADINNQPRRRRGGFDPLGQIIATSQPMTTAGKVQTKGSPFLCSCNQVVIEGTDGIRYDCGHDGVVRGRHVHSRQAAGGGQ